MERRGHRQQQRPLGAGELGELHRALDRGRRAGDDDLPAAVVVGRLADRAREIEVARRLRWRSSPPAEIEAEDRRHRALADRDRLLHRLAAQAQKTRGILERQRAGGAKRRIFAERMAGDESRLRRDLEARFRSRAPAGPPCSRPSAPAGRWRSASARPPGPSNISWDRFWDSAASTRSNTSRAAENSSASALPMPTACDP